MTIGVEALPLTFVAHALAVAGAVTVLVWNLYYRGGLAWEATNKSLIFNLHPVLMLIGLIIIGGEAIMSYKSLPLKKEVKKVIHLVLHAIAMILGSVGIAAAFKNHNESNIANLYSLHSWLGISIISLYGIQVAEVGERSAKLSIIFVLKTVEMGEALKEMNKVLHERNIKAWEDKEKAKSANKAQRMLSDIKTWEEKMKISHEAKTMKIEAELESIRQHKHEKIKNEEAQIQKAMEQKKAAIDAQNQKKVLEITEKADKHRSNNTLPMKCFGICAD
eukprot:XP_024438026.1 uncharacterized protein LOC7484383 isoform X1 [Populus trichocarpa]